LKYRGGENFKGKMSLKFIRHYFRVQQPSHWSITGPVPSRGLIFGIVSNLCF